MDVLADAPSCAGVAGTALPRVDHRSVHWCNPALLVELAPARVRRTAVALEYNICLAVTGGATPLIAAWLVQRTSSEISPALLIMLGAALTTAAMLRTEETATPSLLQPSEFAA